MPKPSPGPKEVLIRLNAAALNHRDLFVRQQLYPGISFEHPLLADGHGTVIQSGPQCVRNLQDKDVLLFPARGWDAHPDGPEDIRKYRCVVLLFSCPSTLASSVPISLHKNMRSDTIGSVIGGTAMYDAGTAQEYIVCSEEDVEVAPEHLSAIEGAALPLVGLTGWRALVTKTGENASRGRNILITGCVFAMLPPSDRFHMLQRFPGFSQLRHERLFACNGALPSHASEFKAKPQEYKLSHGSGYS